MPLSQLLPSRVTHPSGGSIRSPPGASPPHQLREDGRLRGRPARRPLAGPPEPELLVLRLHYLSRMPASGSLFERPANYILSVHVGEDARSDPPAHPGRYCAGPVPARPPQAVAPEEEALRQHVARAIDSMRAEALAAEAPGSLQAGAVKLECRFKARVSVRLSEEGPGPAAGGPPYFRVDVWAEREGTMFRREHQRELFARVFVPLTEPKWQRRPCTWPAVDALGHDVAYLTCEFAFARVPPAVSGLQVEGATSEEVLLSWRPPPNDRVAPTLKYHVEALAHPHDSLPSTRPPPGWQPAGEVAADADPHITVRSLRPNTRYRFRVHAANEAGAGPAVEVEAATGPSAPGACGQPRLAGCKGPVLTVEWDGPEDDCGAEVVAYRLWVRPDVGNPAPDEDAWFEVGHVTHDKAGVQRAEIHTEDLNPGVSRYFCRVAAINDTGEVGPPTSEPAKLPFPNPCAICGPNIGQALPAIADYQAARMLGSTARSQVAVLWAGQGRENSMMLLEKGAAERQFLLAASEEDLPPPARSAAPLPQERRPPGADGTSANIGVPLPPDLPGYSSYEEAPRVLPAELCETVALGVAGSPDLPAVGSTPLWSPSQQGGTAGRGVQVWEQHDVACQNLERKRNLLETSLARYRQLAIQLSYSPEDQLLIQNHIEAEIEAASFQAEVAVLEKEVAELDRALHSQAPGGLFAEPDPLGFQDLLNPTGVGGAAHAAEFD